MNDMTWLRKVPYGGYSPPPAQPPVYAHYYPYVGQYPYGDPSAYPAAPPDETMRSLGTTLALAAVSFVLFGGLGAAIGYLVHPSTKGAAVGAYLGLAALQGSSAIRRST